MTDKKTKKKTTIHVNNVVHHLSQTEITASELRDLSQSPADYEVTKIVGAPDPEGQPLTDDLVITGSIAIKSGDKFRVVPPGTFGR